MKILIQSKTLHFFVTLVTLGSVLNACGKSIYSPAANKKTNDAVLQDAILALNSDRYEEASSKLESVWESNKTLEISQLYSISLLGQAGFSLFDVIKKALATVTDSNSKQNSAGNAILDKISSIVGTNLTEAQYTLLKKAVTVLNSADDQSNAGLKFQKCLTAGIYAAPTIAGLSSSILELQTKLKELPTKLSASGATCGASSATINETGASLTLTISQAASLASKIQDIESVMGDCLPAGTAESVNQITKKVANLVTKADKGCSIPSTQTVGSYTLPSCMNTFVLESGGSTAVSGDKKLSGCEVFLNCVGASSCFE
jgi:hypothetical protein